MNTSVQIPTFVEVGREDRRAILRRHFKGNLLDTLNSLFAMVAFGFNGALGNYAAAVTMIGLLGFYVIGHIRNIRKRQRELDEFDSEQEANSRSLAALRLGWPGDKPFLLDPRPQFEIPLVRPSQWTAVNLGCGERGDFDAANTPAIERAFEAANRVGVLAALSTLNDLGFSDVVLERILRLPIGKTIKRWRDPSVPLPPEVPPLLALINTKSLAKLDS